jgi:hypothetical protein
MRFFALLGAVFLFSVSCDYEPMGEHFVVRPQPDATGMSVTLTETSDTVKAYGNAEIFYESIIQNKEVRYFQAYLNGESVLTQVLGTGSFFLYTSSMADGCYTLRIEINTSSGTGSLADVRQLEDLRVSRTYVLCVDNSKPKPVAITSIARVDGTLELQWEKYTRSNFQRYILIKYCYNQGFNYYEPHWTKEITSNEITSLRDSTFIGGKVKYFISVIGANQESDAAEREFEDPYDLDVTWAWVDKTNIRASS